MIYKRESFVFNIIKEQEPKCEKTLNKEKGRFILEHVKGEPECPYISKQIHTLDHRLLSSKSFFFSFPIFVYITNENLCYDIEFHLPKREHSITDLPTIEYFWFHLRSLPVRKPFINIYSFNHYKYYMVWYVILVLRHKFNHDEK